MWWLTGSLITIVVVMLGVIIWSSGWRPGFKNPFAWSSNSKPTKVASSSGGFFNFGCMVLLVLLAGMGACTTCTYRLSKEAMRMGRVGTTKKLVLMDKCVAPCSVDIEWQFTIHTEGDPLWIKFPGVEQPHFHPGKGEVEAPEGAQNGETFFESADLKNPHPTVWVYRVE